MLNAEAPDTAAVVERLDGEHAAPTVAESEVPAGADAVRGGELGPPAPQERAAAVPPEPDGPDVPGLDAARADDEGLPGADLLGEFVGDALQCVEKVSHFLGRPAPALAKRAGRRNGGGVALTHQLVFAEERQQHPELLGGGRTTAMVAGGRRHGWAGKGTWRAEGWRKWGFLPMNFNAVNKLVKLHGLVGQRSFLLYYSL